MEEQRRELHKLIEKFTEYQIGYLLTLVYLINKLSEYQTRYLLAFVKKRFKL